MVCRNT